MSDLRGQLTVPAHHAELRRHPVHIGVFSWRSGVLVSVLLIAALATGLVAAGTHEPWEDERQAPAWRSIPGWGAVAESAVGDSSLAQTCRQLVSNPGFEEGAAGWEIQSRSEVPIIVPDAAFEGRLGARLGGTNNADDRLIQAIAFPRDLSAASLSFFFRLDSEDQRSPGPDRFTIRLLDESGARTLITIAELDSQSATGGWLRRVHPLDPEQLAAIAGQTVRLVFRLTSDATAPTTVFLDEVSFQACVGGPPSIPELRMSGTAGGPSRDSFQPGTDRVYIAFDYANLREQDTIRLIVRDPLGIKLLDRTYPDLEGSGTEEVVLTGGTAVESLVEAAETAGTTMVDSGQRALDAKERGRFVGYVQQALTASIIMENALIQLGKFGLDTTANNYLTNAQEHLRRAMDALHAALDPNRSFEQARAQVQIMRDEAQQATTNVMAMQQFVQGSSFAFPATADCAFYLTNVYLDGFPAASIQWTVGTPGQPDRIHPPRDSQRAGTLRAEPLVLYTQGVTVPGVPYSAVVSGRIIDAECLPVADGTAVSLSLDDPELGVLQPVTAITTAGYFSATVTSTELLGSGLLTVRARAGDAQAVATLFLVGPPATLTLRTTADALEAGQSVPIMVRAVDALGHRVADGTQVTFGVSPPGAGSVSPSTAFTTDGYAGVTFTAGNVGGEVRITAYAGAVSDSIDLRVFGPTPTPTWTPTVAPTITPTPLPTQTPTPAPVQDCDRRDPEQVCNAQLLVHVFEDLRCDRRFSPGMDRPLLDVSVTLVYPDGRSELAKTSPNGYAYFGGINLRGDEQLFVLVEYPEEMVMAGLTPCPNSSTFAILDRDDFGPSRSTLLAFRAHRRFVTREGFLRPAETSVCFTARYYLEPTDDGPVVFILTDEDLAQYLNRRVRVTGSTWEIQYCNYLQLMSIELVE